ncbi:hypothetical protein [Prochlorococcus marinus]|uniref:hypothetical protein n=1 Tax=Prochlorococcus marinus TaxID=1219 RepID=UPI0039B109A9
MKLLTKDLMSLQAVEDNLYNQMNEYNTYPFYYIVVTYTTRDKNIFELNNLKRLEHIHKTNRLLRRKLKESFEVDIVNMFQERHKGYQEKWYKGDQVSDWDIIRDFMPKDDIQLGDMVNNGTYHTNIIMSVVDIEEVLSPPINRRCKKLFSGNGRQGIPVENCIYQDSDDLTLDLINSCCRSIEDVASDYSKAVVVEELHTPEDLRHNLHYCLKDCYEKGVDWNQIIDFDNSDFFKEDLCKPSNYV